MAFKMFDKDKNGQLDKREIEQALAMVCKVTGQKKPNTFVVSAMIKCSLFFFFLSFFFLNHSDLFEHLLFIYLFSSLAMDKDKSGTIDMYEFRNLADKLGTTGLSAAMGGMGGSNPTKKKK